MFARPKFWHCTKRVHAPTMWVWNLWFLGLVRLLCSLLLLSFALDLQVSEHPQVLCPEIDAYLIWVIWCLPFAAITSSPSMESIRFIEQVTLQKVAWEEPRRPALPGFDHFPAGDLNSHPTAAARQRLPSFSLSGGGRLRPATRFPSHVRFELVI